MTPKSGTGSSGPLGAGLPQQAPRDATDLFAAALQHWSRRALDLGWVEAWVEGSIFPCEMVFFLARALERGVGTIVESGRQDGISTENLGHFARETGVRVVSVDLEEDAERAAACRRRLAPYPLEIVKGNAFSEVPRAVAGGKGGVALLIDGPKGFPALAMGFGCTVFPHVRTLAFHNLDMGGPLRPFVLERASRAPFYEDDVGEAGRAWADLRAHEERTLAQSGARRSLETSSLGVLDIDDATRARLTRGTDRRFLFNQPPLLAVGWKAGLFDQTRYLFSLSFRLASD